MVNVRILRFTHGECCPSRHGAETASTLHRSCREKCHWTVTLCKLLTRLQTTRQVYCGTNRAPLLRRRDRHTTLDPYMPPRYPKPRCPARRTRTTRGGNTGWRCPTRRACEIESLMCHTGSWVRQGSRPSRTHTGLSHSAGFCLTVSQTLDLNQT